MPWRKGSAGQASVEYLVVGLVLVVAAAGIAVLWRYGSGGGFADLLSASSSHALGSAGGVLDVLLF